MAKKIIIKMSKKSLIKEHKRVTKLLKDTIFIIDVLSTIVETKPFLTKRQFNKLLKVDKRLKNEYEDQLRELNELVNY